EFLREELGRLQAAIGQSGLPVFANVEVFEGAILVPRLDARPQQPPLSAVCRLAVAWRHAADAIRLDGLPARALTLGALPVGHIQETHLVSGRTAKAIIREKREHLMQASSSSSAL